MSSPASFSTGETSLRSTSPWKLLLIGVLVVVFVFASRVERRSSTLIEWLLNPDHIISLSIDWHSDHPSGTAVTVVDVDDASFEAWGQPLSVPRGKLFDLVDALDQRGAAAIIVDVDLTIGPTVDDVNETIGRIADYAARSRIERNHTTPLILVRELWEIPRDKMSKNAIQVRIPTHATNKGPSSLNEAVKRLDALVSGGDTNISSTVIWASTLFEADPTGIIRNWRLLETVCGVDKSNRRTFFSVGLITAALSNEGKQNIQQLHSSSRHYAQQYCEFIESDTDSAHQSALLSTKRESQLTGSANFSWLRFGMTSTRLPYLFWPAPADTFRFGTARDSFGLTVPLVDIRSAATLLEREQGLKDNYEDADFCRKLSQVDPPPLSCEAIRGRVAIIGASHVDSRDSYFTPLGPMAGIYVIANTVAGARDTLLSKPGLKNNANFWGIVLFIIFGILAARVRNLFAIPLGILVATVFLTVVSGWLGIPVSTTYESVNTSIVMLAIFLTAGTIANDAAGWLSAVYRWVLPGKGNRLGSPQE
jgi:CHASE2 domain-containing sensor protein